jgi:hypothetical protein
MAAHDLISVGALALGAIMPLAAMWLRLRFRLHRERERRVYLQAATALPAGSRVREERDDGTRLTVEVGDAPR